VGWFPGGVIWKRQQAASRCHGLGVCRVGVSARMAGHHQEQGRSVGGGEVWQLVAAGSPGAGFGPAAWLAVGFRAGGRQGSAVGWLPGGVIRQRQQGYGLGVSAGMAGHSQEQQRSGWCWGGLAAGGSGSPGAGFGPAAWLVWGGCPVEWPAAQANCLILPLDQNILSTFFA